MLINNVNVFMISNLSDQTVGAVGVANQVLNFLLMVYACIAFGTAVLISQNLGAGRRQVAMESANTAIVLSIVTGLSLGLVLIPAAPTLLALLRVPESMMDAAVSYLRIVGAASVFQALIGTMSAISRNYRYARIPMVITLGMNGLNLAGNMLVVYQIGRASCRERV